MLTCLSLPHLPQIEYFLRKLTEAMGGSWVEERFEDYKLELSIKQQSLSAWELITLVGRGTFSKGVDRQTLSMGITEVFHELILDVFKQVGLRAIYISMLWQMLMSTKLPSCDVSMVDG